MLELRSRLRGLGVLGLNQRNAEFIRFQNPRRLYPLVDDKVLTKQIASAARMPVPELFGVISTQHELRNLTDLLAARKQFVAKPAHGSGGNGVLVIVDRRSEVYIKSSGAMIDHEGLIHHLSNVLSGLYSLGGQKDRVIVEYCVRCDPELARVSFQGVPDVRVIVYRGYPVMAMMRLPTRQSDGRANLHQGAVGVGIDIGSGVTLGGVQENRFVDVHPDTGNRLAEVQIRDWPEILEMAARCYELTGLGYLGVDIVIDEQYGPLILELNARPGLNIQIANRTGLRTRLERIDATGSEVVPAADRVGFCRQAFRRTDGSTI